MPLVEIDISYVTINRNRNLFMSTSQLEFRWRFLPPLEMEESYWCYYFAPWNFTHESNDSLFINGISAILVSSVNTEYLYNTYMVNPY